MNNLQEPNRKDVNELNDITLIDCMHPQYQKDEVQQVLPQKEEKENILAKKTLIKQIVKIVGLIMAILIILGLSLGLTIGSGTSVVKASLTTVAQLADGKSLIFSRIQLRKQRFFINQDFLPEVQQQQIPYDIFLLKRENHPQQNQNARLLQQQRLPHEQLDSHDTFVNFVSLGMSVAINFKNEVKIRVQPKVYYEYVQNQLPEQKNRMLMLTPDPSEWATAQQIEDQLGKVIEKQFQIDHKLEVIEEKMTEWVLDQSTRTFQLKQDHQIHSKSLNERFLEIAQIPPTIPSNTQQESSTKSIIQKVIEPVVQKVVKPIIQLIKGNQKQISELSETIDGSILQNQNRSLGAVAGTLKINIFGSIIDDVASTALKTCIPKDSYTIKCTQESVKDAAEDMLKDKAITFVIINQLLK